MKNGFLEIGKIVAIHGLKGELRVQPWCDTPDLLADQELLFLDGREKAVERGRVQKNIVILKLSGIDTPEDAQKQVGKILLIHRDQLELPENSYFIADLIGLKVIDADTGAEYGELTDVTATGANDVYHVRFADGKVRYVPAIGQVVLKTDLENGVMAIRPLPGLFED